MSESVFGIPITMFDFDKKSPMFSLWKTVSIIPASGVDAKFKDGESVPVIAWANQVCLCNENKNVSILQRVVGLVVSLETSDLISVDECDGFETYQ